jgi:methionine salvage enolase-phosphatase E1|tara:strand:- start:920 stop:1120 length:201 start_codon:yes stop_codon:yes gene_type:complete
MFSNAKKKLQDVIEKHTERNLEMQRVSEILGIDVSFSEEELIKHIEEDMAKYYEQMIIEEATAWMK